MTKKVLQFFLIALTIILAGCPEADEIIEDGEDTEEPDQTDNYLPDGQMMDYVLGRIQEMNPDLDLPDFAERETLSMPKELESWNAEEEKAEIEAMINDTNAIAENPYNSLRLFIDSSRSVSREITGYEEIMGSCSPEYSSCTYRWVEDGEVRITWIDIHTMDDSDEETVFTWLVQIIYEYIDENGGLSSPCMVLKDQFTATHYPTTLIETTWITWNYKDNGEDTFYDWSIYRYEYDPIKKLYTTESTVRIWDSVLGYARTAIRVLNEKPDTEELFDYPPIHTRIFFWGVSINNEYLRVDLYIDIETNEWSYTIYNEYGVTEESGSS